jgi:hypothetical protein
MNYKNSRISRIRTCACAIIVMAAATAALASIGGGGGGGGDNLLGRMTGGGSIISNGLRVTHGLTLNCDATQNPQRLEINWAGNRFHLEQLNTAFCSKNPGIDAGQPSAAFNTYTGSGAGRFNGVSGSTIDVVFTDAGEPGAEDFASYTIHDAEGNLVLTASGNLDKGNHQVHNP